VSRQDQAQSLEDIDLLALSPDGSVYVLDNTFGMLVRYDQRGGQSGQWTLPGPYRDSILASREGLRRANPGVVYIGYPFAVTLHTMPDGRLFMFRSLSVFLVGVVFDPRTERFVTLAQDGSHRTLDLARGAYFDGSFLTVVHDDGLRMFDTRPQSR
jgi:hypothetical protein